MTTLRLAIAFLLCAVVAPSASIVVKGPVVHAAAGGDPLLPYLLAEGFETPTTGYENTWTESGAGTIDQVYSTSGLDMAGSQCLRIASSATNDNTYADFTSGTTMYGMVRFRYASLGGTTDLIHFRATASTRLIVRISGAGVLTVLHGSASSASMTDAVPSGTTVYLWFKYIINSGATDGVGEVAWSTTTTRPTAGSPKFTNLANGNATANSAVSRIYLGNNASETHEIFFDDVRVDEAGYPQP